MMKWLQNNPVGLAIGGVCALFLFLLLMLTVVASLPISTVLSDDDTEVEGEAIELPALAENKPIDTYQVITDRPLFNQSRRPVIEEEIEDTGEEEPPESDFEMPSVELMGVVITPTEKMVTLKRFDSEESLVAYEGRPIEADFGSWYVSSVGPRTATLSSAEGEELILEMKVNDASIEEPAPIKPAEREGESEADIAAAEGQGEGEPLNRADEIRQRIAERREELKQESDGGQQAEAEPAQPTYKDAIKSLINRNRKEEAENDK